MQARRRGSARPTTAVFAAYKRPRRGTAGREIRRAPPVVLGGDGGRPEGDRGDLCEVDRVEGSEERDPRLRLASARPTVAKASRVMATVAAKTARSDPELARTDLILIHSERSTAVDGHRSGLLGGGRERGGRGCEFRLGGGEGQVGLLQGGPDRRRVPEGGCPRGLQQLRSGRAVAPCDGPAAVLVFRDVVSLGRAVRPAGRLGSLVRTRTRRSLCASMKSCVGVSARRRPRPRTTRWSAKEAVSFIRWLETRTVRPSRARRRSKWRIQTMPSGSRPLVGSSSMRTGGSPRRAAAMPSRWRMPSEKVLMRRCATAVRPVSWRTSSTRRAGRRLPAARKRRWSRAVREPWAACASRRAPTARRGSRSVA